MSGDLDEKPVKDNMHELVLLDIFFGLHARHERARVLFGEALRHIEALGLRSVTKTKAKAKALRTIRKCDGLE